MRRRYEHMTATRIGYLVPEFPGQTHTWIWRECQALEGIGIGVDLVSTRRPRVTCHHWSAQAQSRTHYLFPPRPQAVGAALSACRRAGLHRLLRCAETVFEARDIGFRERAKLAGLLAAGASLAARARLRQWRHLHVASSGDSAFVAGFASQLSGVGYGITLLAPLSGYGPNQAMKWRDAAFGLVMSERLRTELCEALGQEAPARLAVAPMGVDLEQAKRGEPYQPLAVGEVLRLYTCGRLHPVKGHAYLLEALALLRKRGRALQLRIAGGEEGCEGYKADLLGQAERAGLTPHVEFLGPVSEERHRAELESAHVFVLASLDEGISVAAMEAMALETPAVVTDVGGMRELVQPGSNALMVPAQDAQALAAAIEELASTPARALELSRSSRRTIAAKFHHRRGAYALAGFLGHSFDTPSLALERAS